MRLVGIIIARFTFEQKYGGSWYEYFWTLYECALLIISLCTLFAVADRWKLMQLAARQYKETKQTAYMANVIEMCQVHENVVMLASASLAMALFQMYRMVKYTDCVFHIEWTLHVSGSLVFTIVAYSLIIESGTWYGSYSHAFFNALVFGRNMIHHSTPWLQLFISTTVTVYFLLYATIVSIVTKRYALSKMYTQQYTTSNDVP